MRRARARGSHAGVQRRSPDRVLSVGALGARKRTLQRPTSSHARAASLTPLVGRAGERIALEADGPYHFAANTLAPGGAVLARHRLLAARGWAVISVPGYVWKELEDAGRGAWLMQARLLRCSLVAAWLPVLCTPLAQGLRLVSTLHQYVWWEARFTVLCGRDEGRASTRGVLCRESVAAREAQAGAAAQPHGTPRPVPTFAELAATLAPQRVFEDVVCAAQAAGIEGLRDNG